MRKSLTWLPLLALLAVSACETVKGAGRDIGTAGEVVTDGARQVQNEL